MVFEKGPKPGNKRGVKEAWRQGPERVPLPRQSAVERFTGRKSQWRVIVPQKRHISISQLQPCGGAPDYAEGKVSIALRPNAACEPTRDDASGTGQGDDPRGSPWENWRRGIFRFTSLIG